MNDKRHLSKLPLHFCQLKEQKTLFLSFSLSLSFSLKIYLSCKDLPTYLRRCAMYSPLLSLCSRWQIYNLAGEGSDLQRDQDDVLYNSIHSEIEILVARCKICKYKLYIDSRMPSSLIPGLGSSLFVTKLQLQLLFLTSILFSYLLM